jgi:hypothetical protein
MSRQQEQDLKYADGHLGQAYDLVWNCQPAQYDEAVELLQQALEIQQAYLGKHHPQVGYTLNFIGSTLWMQGSSSHKKEQQQQQQQQGKWIAKATQLQY